MRLDGMPNSGAVSLAHGWSAGPVPALSGYVLGIRPTAPGYRHWVVAPQPGYLRFAQGEAPTPRGPIDSRWRRGGHSFKLTVSAPRGTSGVVELPLLRRPRKVLRDGKVVWSRGRRAGKRGKRGKRRGGVIRFGKVAGQHTFLVQ
jgi:alpha-L-rhamnosidase